MMQIPWHKKAVAQLIFLAALILGQSGNAWAQEEVEPESFLSTDEPIEQVDQRTPLTTAIGFMLPRTATMTVRLSILIFAICRMK